MTNLDNLIHGYKSLFEGKHYGDLGKGADTYLGRMHAGGGDRGDGHFGTGVYYMSDHSHVPASFRNRPAHDINTDAYRLLRPSDLNSALTLYRLLRRVNSITDAAINGLADEDYIRLCDHVSKSVQAYFGKTPGPGWLMKRGDLKARLYASDGIYSKESTLCTDLVRYFGYEGIDVTHVEEMDNSMYGSVIYDL